MPTEKQITEATNAFLDPQMRAILTVAGMEWPSGQNALITGKMAAALAAAEAEAWMPIETAPRVSVNRSTVLTRHPVMTTETLWVRDADGRIYEAWFADTEDVFGRSYWWDCDGETECDPVEWMPHPLWTQEPPHED